MQQHSRQSALEDLKKQAPPENESQQNGLPHNLPGIDPDLLNVPFPANRDDGYTSYRARFAGQSSSQARERVEGIDTEKTRSSVKVNQSREAREDAEGVETESKSSRARPGLNFYVQCAISAIWGLSSMFQLSAGRPGLALLNLGIAALYAGMAFFNHRSKGN